MDLGANTILITGGASGIGLALAERFLQAGSQVIVCGRREEKLREAQARYPALAIRVCDVAEEGERVALARWASTALPRLYGFSAEASRASREGLDAIFARMNQATTRRD